MHPTVDEISSQFIRKGNNDNDRKESGLLLQQRKSYQGVVVTGELPPVEETLFVLEETFYYGWEGGGSHRTRTGRGT